MNDRLDESKHYDADVIWVDWADKNALDVQDWLTPAKKILRIHRYEAFTNVWDTLNPDAFDVVVFVAEHIKKALEERLGREITNAVICSNYVDLEAMTIAPDKELNHNIAYAGYFSRKKGIGELLMIAESMPDYNFHLAGDLQEIDYMDFMQERLPSNVTIYPWSDDLNAFFSKMSYVINTSLSESFSVATVEGMLCGCRPIVRNWEGSEALYPAECIYKSIDDIKRMVESNDQPPEHWREQAITKLELDIVIDRVLNIIHSTTEKDEALPTVTVAIVQTRQKYLGTLLNSLRLQDYPIEVRILQNFDKDKTIGKCFNELADNCTTEWILYVGDDDWLADGYIRSVMDAWLRRKEMFPTTVSITTSTTAFDNAGKTSLIAAVSTGFWKADYIRKNRFDEKLIRQVDTEFFQRFVNMVSNYATISFIWIAGYFYRQHDSNVSGNKFTEGAITHQEKV